MKILRRNPQDLCNTAVSMQIASEVVSPKLKTKKQKKPKLKHFLIEPKIAYFQPQDNFFRDMYKNGFINILEFGYYINKDVCISLEGGYFHKHGMMKDLEITTALDQIPISFLLKCIIDCTTYMNLYLKVGPNYIFSREVINYPGFGSPTANVFGITGGFGIIFNFGRGWLADIFANYRYDKKTINNNYIHRSTYLGGLDLGFGLGIRF